MDRFNQRLSEYLDDELTPGERAALEAHLAECENCRTTLAELREVTERAASLPARPPHEDLWSGIAARLQPRQSDRVVGIGAYREARSASESARRFSFTATELAAAALLLIATSASVSWLVRSRMNDTPTSPTQTASATQPVSTSTSSMERGAIRLASFGDPQYDAAVADLQHALEEGRGRLDKKTIDVLEKNLAVIDEAIDQARRALAADPANAYLNSYLADARRRKLELLRGATAVLANLQS
jgi:Putative zinc-finger